MKRFLFFSRLNGSRVTGFFLFLVFAAFYTIEFVSGTRRQDIFTWMDPYQYFDFARDFVSGIRPFNGFELPSIFPYFIVPFLKLNATIPSALHANILFIALLLFAGYFLCRHFTIGKWYGIAAVSFLCSPLIIGLSRSLYVELALSAIVAWQCVLWFRSDHFTRPWPTGLFVPLFCIGIMTKSTYPVFFIGPFFLEAAPLLHKKNFAGLLRLIALFLGPVAVVLLLQRLVFPDSFEYYLTGFYTGLPIMGLIGPSKVSLPASLGYYFINIWKTMLFLLTPFLLFPLLPSLRKKKDLHLWMWFIASLAVLTVPQVKEPRHVAPAVFPALLLVVIGVSRIKKPIIRTFLMSLIAVLSLSQYFLTTRHLRDTPYFIDRPSFASEISERMLSVDPERTVYTDSTGAVDFYRWKFSRNFVITGYDPPMALALMWHLGPGVTYAADFMEKPGAKPNRYGYDHFEDLFFLESFNGYNRQCLWNSNYTTLDYRTVIDQADFLIAGEETPDDLGSRYPGFHPVRKWKTVKGTVRLLQADTPSRATYRTLYARRYLAEGKQDPETRSAIVLDLILNAASRHDSAGIRKLRKELGPQLNNMAKPKKIYWIRTRAALLAQMNAYLSRNGK